jgi:exodeoxyribonuclease V alpha subunit
VDAHSNSGKSSRLEQGRPQGDPVPEFSVNRGSEAAGEPLSGLIERVTFFNEENGFSVLRVKVRGHRDLVTVVGSLPSATAGEWLNAEGRWVRDRQHGLQFQAALLKSSPPSTREGIEKYLGSGMVKGIGPVYARKLVDKFGEKIFDIIENYSARIEEVEGIGPGRRKRIKQAWQEQKLVREIMVFLHSHGVSTSRAVRIYKTYGDSAIERIRANPYLLARDIPGIGFHTADQIAQRTGIAPDSILRAGAGLRHLLLEAMGEGHCALPRSLLLESALELLKVSGELVARGLLRLLEEKELAVEEIGSETLIFLPSLRFQETVVAREIRRLATLKPVYPPIHLDKAIAFYEERSGLILAPSQKEALRQALESRLLVITGGPGVGKTTLLNTLLQILRAKKVNCLLAAPTGRAARRLFETTGMTAKTIHRLLEARSRGGGFSRNEQAPLDCDLLVLDEASMIDVPLMCSLLRALPERSGLLMVGDADQLPSVGPGAVLQDFLGSGRVPNVKLHEIFRQAAGSQIIVTAHQINQGIPPPTFIPGKDSATDSDFYFIERDQPEEILGALLDMVATRIPRKFGLDPVREIQVLSPMNRGSLGVRELNLQLQQRLNPPAEDQPVVEKFGWQFRQGDKVIQTENNYDKEVFNGDIGRVREIDGLEQELLIEFDGREVVYEFSELDELSLAYAISIHKSQGSEFPVVVIPLAMQHYLLLQRNLLYTGVTRGRKLVILIGQKKAAQMAVRNIESKRRYSGLLTRLKAE